MNHTHPLSHPSNIPPLFSFLIQHLHFSLYLSTSTLLSLQRVNHAFFHIISPLFYRDLTIDLKDPRNPATSIWPYNFYPNPRPPFSRFKNLVLGYTEVVEWVGSHSSECKAFLPLPSTSNNQPQDQDKNESQNQDHLQDGEQQTQTGLVLVLPKLLSCRITLPSGKYKSWCGLETLDSATIRTKGDIRCGLLRTLRSERLIVEMDQFRRIDLFGRRDLWESGELVCRIGRVGEDAVLGLGLGVGEWPLVEGLNGDEDVGGLGEGKAPDEGNENTSKRGKKRKGRGSVSVDRTQETLEDWEIDSDEGELAQGGIIPESDSSSGDNEPAEPDNIPQPLSKDIIQFIQSLDLIPSLNSANTIPDLTIIFLSPPKDKIAQKLISGDKRTDEQRVNHHLLALASVLCTSRRSMEARGRCPFEQVRLVNAGVLMFYKYAVKREESELRKMQDEVKGMLKRLVEMRLGVTDLKEEGTGQVEGVMNKVEFVLLDEYLKEEKKRSDQVKMRARAGQRNIRSLY